MRTRRSRALVSVAVGRQEVRDRIDQPVLVGVAGGVATIPLNRPGVLNALNQSMAEALVQAIQECMDDEGVRAGILNGAG